MKQKHKVELDVYRCLRHMYLYIDGQMLMVSIFTFNGAFQSDVQKMIFRQTIDNDLSKLDSVTLPALYNVLCSSWRSCSVVHDPSAFSHFEIMIGEPIFHTTKEKDMDKLKEDMIILESHYENGVNKINVPDMVYYTEFRDEPRYHYLSYNYPFFDCYYPMLDLEHDKDIPAQPRGTFALDERYCDHIDIFAFQWFDWNAQWFFDSLDKYFARNVILNNLLVDYRRGILLDLCARNISNLQIFYRFQDYQRNGYVDVYLTKKDEVPILILRLYHNFFDDCRHLVDFKSRVMLDVSILKKSIDHEKIKWKVSGRNKDYDMFVTFNYDKLVDNCKIEAKAV